MTVEIPFERQMDAQYGRSQHVTPLVRRVLCNNPGPFTYLGTGTTIVGQGTVAVIDPGPVDAAHTEALLAALEGETVSHILITHTHVDHSPGAAALKAATGAPTWGYGPHAGGRPGEGEGGDPDFMPDHRLADGDRLSGPGWTLTALHTPGHASNHLCFALEEEKLLFSGDLVMAWSTTVVSPPDGNMADYMTSLRRLVARDDQIYVPAHGPELRNPQRFVRLLAAHREQREKQILDCIGAGLDTIPAMVRRMYAAVEPKLHPAAERSTLAAMENLVATGRVTVEGGGPVRADARYRLSGA